MKKIFYIIILLVLIFILFLFSSCEKTVKNNGSSKTYKYLENLNTDRYNINIQSEDTKINIIKDHDKVYLNSTSGDLTRIIIEKNNNKYNIDVPTKTYIKEKINKNDNYLGDYYLSKNSIKNKTYKKGHKFIGIMLYSYEKYNYNKGTITYYYFFNKLKYIENKMPLKDTRIKIINNSDKIDKSVFNVPNYQEMTY